jgi:type II restriction enzyme
MQGTIISRAALARRKHWIAEIRKLSGNFGADSTRLQVELRDEVAKGGGTVLRDHLRLCGAIPEGYKHDSSEEKLYSKYTDILLSLAFGHMGIRSAVLTERADAADVECWADGYEFVADAKAFRLGRTAKNRKDFKVTAMHKWKRGRDHAIVVCPLYQLPSRSSQIYQQAINEDVCILSFSHLSLLTAFAEASSKDAACALLRSVFKLVDTLHPSKDAQAYWKAINQTFLGCGAKVKKLWRDEKQASSESVVDAKEEALLVLSEERRRILALSHEQAIQALVQVHKLEAREKIVSAVCENGLMEIS